MKSIVLLSGGLDSAVCLAQGIQETEVIKALTFDYGQRAREREKKAAEKLCHYYGIEHEIIPLDYLQRLTKTALVNREEELPKPSLGDLDDIEGQALVTAREVWVPNRNGLFINIAACFAESLGADLIITGFNREEAATFPDNSPQFIEAINQSLSYSVLHKVAVTSFTQNLDKKGIVALGLKLDLPFQYLWSCYEEEEMPCGKCESCLRLKRALEANHAPTMIDFKD